jgi:hypothetical protein
MEQLGKEAAKLQERLKPERVNALWREYFERILSGTCTIE